MLGGLCMPLGVSVPFSLSTILPVSSRGGGTGPGVQRPRELTANGAAAIMGVASDQLILQPV